jgi:hypothetical protein
MTNKRKKPWAEMGITFDRDSREETPHAEKETPKNNRELLTCTEKARQPVDLASLPPCSPEIIRDGKPCILQKNQYQEIYFPGHKAPEKKPESVKWGSKEKKPEEKPIKTEWGRDE